MKRLLMQIPQGTSESAIDVDAGGAGLLLTQDDDAIIFDRDQAAALHEILTEALELDAPRLVLP